MGAEVDAVKRQTGEEPVAQHRCRQLHQRASSTVSLSLSLSLFSLSISLSVAPFSLSPDSLFPTLSPLAGLSQAAQHLYEDSRPPYSPYNPIRAPEFHHLAELSITSASEQSHQWTLAQDGCSFLLALSSETHGRHTSLNSRRNAFYGLTTGSGFAVNVHRIRCKTQRFQIRSDSHRRPSPRLHSLLLIRYQSRCSEWNVPLLIGFLWKCFAACVWELGSLSGRYWVQTRGCDGRRGSFGGMKADVHSRAMKHPRAQELLARVGCNGESIRTRDASRRELQSVANEKAFTEWTGPAL